MRVRPAEAERGLIGPSSDNDPGADERRSLSKLGAGAGSANGEGSAAAAQQHRQEQDRLPAHGYSAGSAKPPSSAMQQQGEQAAEESEVAAESMKLAEPAADTEAAAARDVPELAAISQNPPGLEPSHPPVGAAAQTTAPTKAAPANLVTSWGPRGVPQAVAKGAYPSLGLAAPGTSSLVHSAGKTTHVRREKALELK